MPLYEYQCDACGHRFEKIQKFSDPLVDTCPKCGGMVMIKAPADWSEGSAVRAEQPTVSDVISASPAKERKLAGSAFEDVEDLLSDAPPKLPSAAPPSVIPPSASPPNSSPTPARATPSASLPRSRRDLPSPIAVAHPPAASRRR